jgi:hypothetical protein
MAGEERLAQQLDAAADYERVYPFTLQLSPDVKPALGETPRS